MGYADPAKYTTHGLRRVVFEKAAGQIVRDGLYVPLGNKAEMSDDAQCLYSNFCTAFYREYGIGGAPRGLQAAYEKHLVESMGLREVTDIFVLNDSQPSQRAGVAWATSALMKAARDLEV